MSSVPEQIRADVAPPPQPLQWLRDRVGLYLELGKARLSGLVVATAAVGFVLASGGRIDWALFGWTLLGTGLAAGAAGALNQVWEAGRDARMPRTSGRPLPSGRMGWIHAMLVGLAGAGAGVTILAALVHPLAAALCLLTLLVYLLLYTPLKVRTTLNTLVGSVVGAIPPMIGWVAASGRLDAGAWVLAALLFVWQVPHFLALAWIYRRDYELGGYRMLPSGDPDGTLTCRTVILWSLALWPVALAATWVGVAGWIYAAGSLLLGGWLVWLALDLQRARGGAEARRLFLATVLYLPLLMGLMVLDRVPADAGPTLTGAATISELEPAAHTLQRRSASP